MANVRAKLTALGACVDDQGRAVCSPTPIFSRLGAKSAAAALTGILRRGDSDLSGITDEDVEELAEEMVEHPFDETSIP